MRRSLVLATAFLASTTVLATGCTRSSGGIASPALGPSSSKPSSAPGGDTSGSLEAWADDFCGAALLLKDPPTRDFTNVDTSDPTAAHEALDSGLTDFENFLQTGVDAFNKLGPSPEPTGDLAKQKIVELLQPVVDSMRRARTKLEASSPTDLQALLDAAHTMEDIGSNLSSAVTVSAVALWPAPR
jgi:hypothetical protein